MNRLYYPLPTTAFCLCIRQAQQLVEYNKDAILPMPFDGSAENPHFFRHEDSNDQLLSLESCYKTFTSLTRDLNLRGVCASRLMFQSEYSDVILTDSSLAPDCRIFASRSRAESLLWKKQGSILEIGVASGSHAVSLIQSTLAKSYCGIDINFAQLSPLSKEHLLELSDLCSIELISKNSLFALNELLNKNCLFDSIYIDASHWYYYASREIELCSRLLALDGRIVLNDYLDWFVGSMEPCGVKKAVNEFLYKHNDWQIDYYAINECDVSIVRNSAP